MHWERTTLYPRIRSCPIKRIEHQRRQQRERIYEQHRTKPLKATTLSYRSEKQKTKDEILILKKTVYDFQRLVREYWLDLTGSAVKAIEKTPHPDQAITRSDLNKLLKALKKFNPARFNDYRDFLEKQFLEYRRAEKQLEVNLRYHWAVIDEEDELISEEELPNDVIDDFHALVEKHWSDLTRSVALFYEEIPERKKVIERSELDRLLNRLKKHYESDTNLYKKYRDQLEEQYLEYQRAINRKRKLKEREEILEDHPEIREFLDILSNFNYDYIINDRGEVISKDNLKPINKSEAEKLLNEGVVGTIRFYTKTFDDDGDEDSGKNFVFEITNPTLKSSIKNFMIRHPSWN